MLELPGQCAPDALEICRILFVDGMACSADAGAFPHNWEELGFEADPEPKFKSEAQGVALKLMELNDIQAQHAHEAKETDPHKGGGTTRLFEFLP